MYLENAGIKDPNAAVTYAQGRMIAAACGGIKKICPSYEEGASAAEALTEMGLTKGKASDVIDALEQAGLKEFNFGDEKAAKAAKATAILNRIGSISCRVPSAGRGGSAPRSTGRQAASGARGGARMAPEGFPELDITSLMLGRGMSRAEAVRFLQLMGGR
jgi:hypothetical protein